MSKLEIQRQLVCSTAHITKNDSHILGEMLDEARDPEGTGKTALAGLHDKREYGWWVYVPERHLMEAQLRIAKKARLSDAFLNLLRFARKNRCDWVMLDRDGPRIDELPYFEW